MVINSLFIINTVENKIFMEKHWRAAIKRSIMDEFMDKLRSVKVLLNFWAKFWPF